MTNYPFTLVPVLSAAGASIAITGSEQAAAASSLRVSIAIVDNVGNLLAFHRRDGACVTTVEAAIRKARTAAQLGLPTKAFEDLLQQGMTSLLVFEFITASQGGVPVILDGVVVGGVGCSGSSGKDDEMIASAGAAALTKGLSVEPGG